MSVMFRYAMTSVVTQCFTRYDTAVMFMSDNATAICHALLSIVTPRRRAEDDAMLNAPGMPRVTVV